jgi:hypothetical protein
VAVADFLITSLNDPQRPLADVALLLSATDPRPTYRNPRTGTVTPVAGATIDDLEEALTEWRALGDKGEDHRLVMYWCGHGIARGTDVTLLASDFGAKPANVLDGAVDFHTFLQGMDGCAAREQVYFIDACRASSDRMLRADRANGRPIFTPDTNTPAREVRRAPVFYSTLAGARAYALEGQPSPFADALLQGLAGAGADDSEGGWRVTTGRLKEAMDFFLERATREIGRAQVPAADSLAPIMLTLVAGDPTGTVIVTCDPPRALADVTLGYAAPGGVLTKRPRRSGEEWVLELPTGMYEFRAEAARGTWVQGTASAYIRPVYRKIALRVQR